MKSIRLTLFVSFLLIFPSLGQTTTDIMLNAEHLGTACKSICGTYYNGNTWIFFDDYHLNSNLLNYLHYAKAQISNDSLVLIKDQSTLNAINDFNFSNRFYSSIQPACCVFQNKLYLFVTENDDNVWYTYFDGTNWSEPVQLVYKINSTTGNVTTQIGAAATVLNNKLYFFFQSSNSTAPIFYVTSVDGINWNTLDQVPMGTYTTRPVGNLSAVTFSSTKDQKEHIMIAFPFTSGFCKTMCFDDVQGWYLQNIAAGPTIWGTGLLQGSRNYLNGTASTSPVQLAALGVNGAYWINEFNSSTEQWGAWQAVGGFNANDNKLSFPSLLSGFKTVNNSLQKELWFSNINYGTLTGLSLKVLRMDSDKFTPVETISEAFNNPDQIRYWKMFGVVEGPPPFALNANSFSEAIYNNTYGPSVFTYTEETTTQNTYTTSWSVNTSVSASGVVGVLGFGADLSAALKNTETKDTTFQFKTTQSIRANQSSLGYYCFFKPTITRTKYSLQSFGGNDAGLYQYIFNITDAQIILKDFDLTTFPPNKFNTLNIWSYKDTATSGYKLYPTLQKAKLGFSWTQGTTAENSKTFSSSTSVENEGSMSIKVSTGVPEIFDISAGFDMTLSEKHTTTFGQQISVLVNCPDPRPAHSEDVRYFSGDMIWLDSPTDGNAYWIPKNYNGFDYTNDKPWCITWTVYDIQTMAETPVDKNKNEIPKEYFLSQNYPNPFNPTTTINYSVPQKSFVTIKVYDVLGREVTTLVNQYKTQGIYDINFDASKLSSGMYIYQLKAGASTTAKPGQAGSAAFVSTKKMLLLK